MKGSDELIHVISHLICHDFTLDRTTILPEIARSIAQVSAIQR